MPASHIVGISILVLMNIAAITCFFKEYGFKKTILTGLWIYGITTLFYILSNR